ncbi:MAG: phosphatidylserine decarboxylase family protein [Bacteroidetes bacterium]|nr:phosphatidylserine decarboxylase family protein [Bacteroidota bacterium]
MFLHKEGYPTILISIGTLTLLCYGTHLVAPEWLFKAGVLISIALFVIVLQFFRNPLRSTQSTANQIIAPADGKVVVIEEVEETEYFKDKRIQVSIFMSPFNVHVNRYPIGGDVDYAKYHPGKYLVAWHPKSSTENERTTIVVKNNGKAVLFRQIAGALARRIVMYSKTGDKAIAGGEMGFIKFGSRVDLFLPLGTKINVSLQQVVRGGETIIADLV